MAASAPQPTQLPLSVLSAPREGRPPEGIQPGGGLCIDLEAAWGRLRRAWLRKVRPGYVRRMAARRQGQCEGCAHDVIDPRDLKLVRNVCGYRFRPEDDAFGWRGRLFLARAGLAEVVCASLGCGGALALSTAAAARTGSSALWLVSAAIALLWFQLVWFFRDPRRVTPADPHALIAPADGIVTHLEEVDAPGMPNDRAFRISIYLSPFDVHLNRNPRNAKVVDVRYFPGRFLNARHKDCVAVNEQLWTDFVEPNGRPLRVKQVSGALARRLVCELKVGEEVRVGERFGLIKYGSRTDVLIPAGERQEVAVRVGERIWAGETVLLRFLEDGDGHGAQRT